MRALTSDFLESLSSKLFHKNVKYASTCLNDATFFFYKNLLFCCCCSSCKGRIKQNDFGRFRPKLFKPFGSNC